MVKKWADEREIKPFSGSGHVTLPKKLVGETVYIEMVEDGDE